MLWFSLAIHSDCLYLSKISLTFGTWLSDFVSIFQNHFPELRLPVHKFIVWNWIIYFLHDQVYDSLWERCSFCCFIYVMHKTKFTLFEPEWNLNCAWNILWEKIVIEEDCLSIDEDVHSSPARLINGRSLQKEQVIMTFWWMPVYSDGNFDS